MQVFFLFAGYFFLCLSSEYLQHVSVFAGGYLNLNCVVSICSMCVVK